MTASNHAVTGALIVAAVNNPVVGLPLALGSHLVLDIMPHYGDKNHTSLKFLIGLAIDAGILIAFFLWLALFQPASWGLIVAGAFISFSPDLLWAPYWFAELKGKRLIKHPWVAWLAHIQKYESPKNLWIELVWFTSMFWLLLGNIV